MVRPPTLLRFWGSHFKSLEHAERIASYFAAARAAGWSCHIVTSREPADAAWLAPLHRDGITIHHLDRAHGNFDRRYIARARRLCRDVAADVMHCDNTHTSPLIGAALAGVSVRLWTKHAMQPAFEEMRAATMRERLAPAVRTSASLSTMILPISGAIRDEMIDLGISSRKLRVLPLPIAPVTAPLIPAADARRQWGLQPHHLVFGTVGRSLAVKGWDLLVKAFAGVHKLFPDSRLLLVGSTASNEERRWRAHLDAIIGAAGIGSAVVFTGHLTSAAEGLAAMDAFVLPSRSEGFSLALVEALAASLPVVSARVGIAPDIVTDRVHGLLVDRDDVSGLTRTLIDLAGNAQLRAQLAAAAPLAVSALPTPQQHAQTLLSIYESLLSRRGRSRAS